MSIFCFYSNLVIFRNIFSEVCSYIYHENLLKLDLKVIAEGVETERQKTYLVECVCKYIQGYFYHKPMPSKKIEKLLSNQ